jgi:hypothetical protein
MHAHPLHHERFAHMIKLGALGEAHTNPLADLGAETDIARLLAVRDNW